MSNLFIDVYVNIFFPLFTQNVTDGIVYTL